MYNGRVSFSSPWFVTSFSSPRIPSNGLPSIKIGGSWTIYSNTVVMGSFVKQESHSAGFFALLAMKEEMKTHTILLLGVDGRIIQQNSAVYKQI